ncbi:hypothetical protein BG005_003792, partial [Podila minutissima]
MGTSCTFNNCLQGLPEKRMAIREGREPGPLTRKESNHLIRSHSKVPVRAMNTFLGVGVVFERCPANDMAFYCHCEKIYWTRDSLAKHYKDHCSKTDIPSGVPGLRLTDISEVATEASLNSVSDDDFEYEPGQEIEPEPNLDGALVLAGASISTKDIVNAFKLLVKQQKESEDRVMTSIADLKSGL